jgi:hypothetical protein
MLDKCANPACFATFRNLRDGRLFVTEIEGERRSSGTGHAGQPQYYWLCSSCHRTMTVTVEKGVVQVVPLPVTAIVGRSAS